MNIAIVSANLGNFEKPVEQVFQNIGHGSYIFRTITDSDFPRRDKSMTPRLQARIVKTHMWDFVPGFDYYLWIDSSCRLTNADSVRWFLDKLGDADIAVFKHPHRSTIQEEANYLKHRLEIKCPYITPRYENELIDEQLEAVGQWPLYASTAFICKDSPVLREAMKEWWYQISRYHSIDQLSFSYAMQSLRVNVIPDNYLKCEVLEYVRNKK